MGRKHFTPLCNSCDAPLRDDAFCPSCGRPTQWATHDERVAWEVRQWRASREQEGPATTMMMLVRTEAGYEPAAVDPATRYIWDQPLHPDRVEPAPVERGRDARPEHPSNGNGYGNGHAAPQPATLEKAPVAPPPDEPAPEPQAALPSIDFDAQLEKALSSDALSKTEHVSISKKAVAVGIALAIGLPLSGKALDLTGSRPEASRVTAAAQAARPAPVVPARPLALGTTRSGFTQVSPDAARFAIVIRNPNRGFLARSVTVSTMLVDAAGRTVGTDIERVAYVPAGSSVAVAGHTGVAGRAAKVTARVSVGSFERSAAGRPFVVSGVRVSRSGSVVVVRAQVSGRNAVGHARVIVVHFDRAGRVLGGDFGYVDVPRSPRAATAVVSTGGLPRGVQRVEVYVLGAA